MKQDEVRVLDVPRLAKMIDDKTTGRFEYISCQLLEESVVHPSQKAVVFFGS
jgi:hypothetical protein